MIKMNISHRLIGAVAGIGTATCLALTGCVTDVSTAPSPGTSTVTATAPETTIRVAALKGPTGMGLAKLIDDRFSGMQATIYGTPDEVTPKLINRSLDVALLPANLAAVLYTKTQGTIQVAAITTLGVLYVVENGDTVHNLTDLTGQTITTTGKSATPQYVTDFILTTTRLTDNVTLEYRSEATEVAALLAGNQSRLGILPEPYVSTVLAKNPDLRVAIDLTAEWGKAAPNTQLVTGVLVVRTQFANDHPETFRDFLDAYQQSVDFTNESPDQAAPLIANLGIVPDEAIARSAIPRCHIVNLTGTEAKAALSGYLKVLYDANPEAVGQKLPDDGFYYQP